MMRKVLGIALVAGTLAAPRRATGQSAATIVSFEMQVNLTNLSPDLERVRLLCMITSTSLAMPAPTNYSAELLPGTTMYVAQGQLVGTITVQFPIEAGWLAPDAIGKQADYQCQLVGFSTSLKRWDLLSDQPQTPSFRLNTSPPALRGSFVW